MSSETIPDEVLCEAADLVMRVCPSVSATENTDRIVALSEALLAAERRGLEKAEKLLAEGYSRDVGEAWRRDGQPSKNDKCSHGAYHYEECLPCAQAAIRSLGDKT